LMHEIVGIQSMPVIGNETHSGLAGACQIEDG